MYYIAQSNLICLWPLLWTCQRLRYTNWHVSGVTLCTVIESLDIRLQFVHLVKLPNHYVTSACSVQYTNFYYSIQSFTIVCKVLQSFSIVSKVLPQYTKFYYRNRQFYHHFVLKWGQGVLGIWIGWTLFLHWININLCNVSRLCSQAT